MEYIIKNHKNVYIRLNSNGRPVTCVEHDKTLFEFSKAKNIVDSLPKSLKRLRFKVEAILEIIVRQEKKVIEKENYLVSANITEWIEKFGICDDILKEAQKRKEELYRELTNIDRQFSNLVHQIELEGKVDLYGGVA